MYVCVYYTYRIIYTYIYELYLERSTPQVSAEASWVLGSESKTRVLNLVPGLSQVILICPKVINTHLGAKNSEEKVSTQRLRAAEER